jgi:hypothetical protein
MTAAVMIELKNTGSNNILIGEFTKKKRPTYKLAVTVNLLLAGAVLDAAPKKARLASTAEKTIATQGQIRRVGSSI